MYMASVMRSGIGLGIRNPGCLVGIPIGEDQFVSRMLFQRSVEKANFSFSQGSLLIFSSLRVCNASISIMVMTFKWGYVSRQSQFLVLILYIGRVPDGKRRVHEPSRSRWGNSAPNYSHLWARHERKESDQWWKCKTWLWSPFPWLCVVLWSVLCSLVLSTDPDFFCFSSSMRTPAKD